MSELTLHVKASSTTTYDIKVPSSATVQAAKDAIQAVSNIPSANQRLIYSGQVMANDRTLESYGTAITLSLPNRYGLCPPSTRLSSLLNSLSLLSLNYIPIFYSFRAII